MFSEVAEIAQVKHQLGQFQQLLKTEVILVLNFMKIHCHYLLIAQRAKLLNFWMLKTVAIVGQGHCSCTLLNLLASFFHSPTFWKCSLTNPCCSSCFHFHSCPLILKYIPHQLSRNKQPQCYRKATSPFNQSLLSNQRTNCERVILPSSQSKINKKYSLHWPISIQSFCPLCY